MPTITKALGQISIVDLTDGYTVTLDQDAGSFQADDTYTAINQTTQFSVNITALQGATVKSGIKIGACIIKDKNGIQINDGSIEASAATGNVSPVTIQVHGGTHAHPFTGEMATVTIPVYVEGGDTQTTSDDIIINKVFTISASVAGESGASSYTHIKYAEDAQGTNMNSQPADSRPYIGIAVTDSSTPPSQASAYAPWTKYLGENGDDGLTYYIHSSNGTYFKNTGVNTRLTVHLYNADGTEAAIPDNLEWYKGDPNNGGIKVTDTTHRSYIDVTPTDVTNTATYFIALEETT
jgi:hypothetical protein